MRPCPFWTERERCETCWTNRSSLRKSRPRGYAYATATEHNVFTLTALQSIPAPVLTDCHVALFKAFNVSIARLDKRVVIYIVGQPGSVGPGNYGEPEWHEWLTTNELEAHSEEPILTGIYSVLAKGNAVDWTDMLQMVLRELPGGDPLCLDFQGYYDSIRSKTMPVPGSCGGMALRITRDAVHLQDSPSDFFAKLDMSHAMIGTPE